MGTSSGSQTVTVENTGNANLIVKSIRLAGGSPNNFTQTNNCQQAVAPGGFCTITASFDPSLPGSLSSNITISDNAAGTPQTVTVTGIGIAPAASVSVASLSFSGQLVGTNSMSQSFTLSNPGTAALGISSIAVTGDFAQNNNCGSSLAAGANCTINVRFSPTAAWTRSGTLIVSDNAFGNPQQLVFLVGMGNSGAAATLSPTSLSYGNQEVGTSSAAGTLTLTNNGTVPLSIISIVASGDYSQTNTCGLSLDAGANCAISVTFSPSFPGTRHGYITVNDTAPSFLQTVTLTGNGVTTSSQVAITPGMTSLTPSQTRQFTATYQGIQTADVTWSVDGVPGGNSDVGTILASGLYTAPRTRGAHSIQAASTANPAQSASAGMQIANYPGTLTNKNDNLRTGQNLNETVLTTGNVNSQQFGKLFSFPVDGYVFAQPLYVQSVNIPSQGVHNIVYVATEYDSLYAFDADNLVSQPLWHTSFIDAANGITPVPAQDVEDGNVNGNIPIWIGITATPVIDPELNTIFTVVRTKEISGGVTSYVQRLHALDMTTGAEQPGSPVVIQASVEGTGAGGNGQGQVPFDPIHENSRPGLLLVNGVIFVAWGSLQDIEPFHGWVMGYDETTLQQVFVWNSTANGYGGGIWGGGLGVAADASGNIFLATGNGTFDANAGGVDYGQSVVKLVAAGDTWSVSDYFAPYNEAVLSNLDWDLGSGGVVLLPDQPGPFPHEALAGGKGGTLFLLNRDDLGQFTANGNQVLLTLEGVGSTVQEAGSRNGPSYWQSQIYYIGSEDVPTQFAILNGMISSAPIAQSSYVFGYPGGSTAVSANGNLNGIVWALQVDKASNSGPAVLRAFDAANISRELYDSGEVSARDQAGPAVKFTVPTVANGKVYVGTQTELDVYGLLP